MSTQPRNIILCFDGTSNEVVSTPTNVLRLCRCLIKDDKQIVYYAPGVGTLLDPDAITNAKKYFRKLWDLATGFSLGSSVSAGYAFLMRNYQPGDRIYVFGFSRGSYAARAMVGMLKMFGLLRPANENLIPYLWQWFRNNIVKQSSTVRSRQELFENARRYKDLFAMDEEIEVELVGVFDTVSSYLSTAWHFIGLIVGVAICWWLPLNTISLVLVLLISLLFSFAVLFRWLPYTASLPNAKHVRHATALDEYRALFPSNHISGLNPEHIEVWFSGVHTDVGGGRPEDKSQLAKVTLRWMLGEAVALGVRVDAQKVKAEIHGLDPEGECGRSMQWYWLLAGLVPQLRYATRKSPGRESGKAKGSSAALPAERTNLVRRYWPNFWRFRYIRRGDRIHASVALRKQAGLLTHPRLRGTTWGALTVVNDKPLEGIDGALRAADEDSAKRS